MKVMTVRIITQALISATKDIIILGRYYIKKKDKNYYLNNLRWFTITLIKKGLKMYKYIYRVKDTFENRIRCLFQIQDDVKL